MDKKSPREILSRAYELIPRLGFAFSGAEDVLLLHYVCKSHKAPRVFTLDTGRLHSETYQFLEQVRLHYGIDLEILTPERHELESLVRNKGLYSFYQDGHQECCGVRKIGPLRRRLSSLDGWISGQRRDQSPTRSAVNVFELDTSSSGTGGALVKVNPFAHWTLQQVWEHIRSLEIPYNPLHDRGYISIGCEPCTRAVRPGQHEREGRWWWEEATVRECGIHQGNLIKMQDVS